MRSSDAKASKCILSGSYVYAQLFHFNGNEKNLFIGIKVKLLNLHIGAWE